MTVQTDDTETQPAQQAFHMELLTLLVRLGEGPDAQINALVVGSDTPTDALLHITPIMPRGWNVREITLAYLQLLETVVDHLRVHIGFPTQEESWDRVIQRMRGLEAHIAQLEGSVAAVPKDDPPPFQA